MADRKELPELSRAELDLIRILWSDGQLSARQVHERLTDDYDWAYSTTRTMLDRMVAKGHLTREGFHGVNLFTPVISRPLGLARLVQDFAERVLEMDPSTVVSLFASGSRLSPAELEELARLIEVGDADGGGAE
ncbi:MAG: BlaI/MecI/CopY family transcriptional regulator [Thermoanaerobaculales bacterium]|nr:BlaI/MecI/CopY family transcriptional regulator [Thermoanaerobaculales bacterium]